MEMRDNPAVIRVPVADPSKNKRDGLLRFSLPRQCLQGECEPQFYAQGAAGEQAAAAESGGESYVPTQPHEAPEAPLLTAGAFPRSAAGTPAAEVDGILEDLGVARHQLGNAQGDVSYARFTVRRTQSDFYRMDYPLDAAERDDAQHDVSEAGSQLDFIMWSARNGLRDSSQGTARAANDGTVAGASLQSAAAKLQKLQQRLAAAGTMSPAVAAALGRAHQALGDATRGSDQVTRSLSTSREQLGATDNELIYADQWISNIRQDRPGVNVSPFAQRLRESVTQVHSLLGATDDAFGQAEIGVVAADEAAAKAEQALRAARQGLIAAESQPTR
jgi:hypothetical protein